MYCTVSEELNDDNDDDDISTTLCISEIGKLFLTSEMNPDLLQKKPRKVRKTQIIYSV